MNNGQMTSEIAEAIISRIPNYRYKVYYDHGDSTKDNVCACKGVLGNEINNSTRIADVDIVIINNENKYIKYLIEIEESGTISPKKLLGDYFALQFIDSVFFKNNEPFPINDETKIMIAGIVNKRGNSETKIKNIIDKIKKLKINNDKVETIIAYDIYKLRDKVINIVTENCT